MKKIFDLDQLITKDMLIDNFQGSHVIYNFKLDDELYYFKEVPNRELVLELISQTCAHLLGIEYLEQSVAILNDKYGLLSKSYLNKNEKSYNLYSLMQDYFFYYLQGEDEDNELSYYESMKKLNNLHDIWFALEAKYHNQETVQTLMNSITNIFIFDMLLSESDRTLKNIQIIEGENGVRVAPLSDTSSTFSDGDVKLNVDQDDSHSTNLNKINKFLSYSDISYKEKFYDFYDALCTTGIENIIEATKNEYGITINQELKEEIVSHFNHNMELLCRDEKKVKA